MGELDREISAIPEEEWATEPEDAEPNGAARRMRHIDLGDLVERDHPRPGVHGHVVYARKMHVLGGEPGHGKSTVVAWWLLKAIARGYTVALLDWEAGADHTADLLKSMGAERASISKYLRYYPHPEWDRVALVAELRAVQPKIVALDSSIAILSAMGGNENSPTDIRRMWNALAPLAHDLGCAVIATDHSGKDAAESRYNRGSTDKLAAVDVSMKLAAEEQFSRSQDGKLRLDVTKDRPGWLHWYWQIHVTRNPLTLHWREARQQHRDGAEMSEGKAAILMAVPKNPVSWQHIVEIKREQSGTGMTRKWATTYLNELADAGLVEKHEQGPGRETLWCQPAGSFDSQQETLGQP